MIMADTIHKLSVVQRDTSGKFLPGSGGRPKGAVARASRDLLKQVRSYGPQAATKLWQALEANERWAVELVLKYCLPPSRTVEFEGMEPDDIREAVKAGDIGISEGNDLSAMVARLAGVDSLDELRTRLSELEQALAEQRR